MKAKLGLTALLLSVLFWAPGGPAAQLASARLEPLASTPLQPASVTVPPQAPVVVPSASALNSRGWAGTAAMASTPDLTGDLLAAYTLAVAVSPPQCHVTTPLLAAIGQVESGNLADHTIVGHRVSPEILGPVLDGTKYRAVKDTDAGRWDHDPVWDRALGPMQIIPASWRVVGLDMDGDGVRDPQNIYDSAGAAMVYLCAGGRDLSSASGLRQAILSYNASTSYLKAVLAWKSVFDAANLDGSGAVPFVASLAFPLATPQAPAPLAHRSSGTTPTTTAAEPIAPSVPIVASPGPTGTPTDPTTPGSPATPATGTPGGSGTPATPGTPTTPSTPTTPGSPDVPTPPTTSGPGSTPTPPADPTPTPPADPTPAADPPPAQPTPLPTCPVPTDLPTDQSQPPTPAPSQPGDPVVSPQTCTPPDGFAFDPQTGVLVPVPLTTPTP